VCRSVFLGGTRRQLFEHAFDLFALKLLLARANLNKAQIRSSAAAERNAFAAPAIESVRVNAKDPADFLE
jgi:hypothetical protein